MSIIRAFWKWWNTPPPNKCQTCGSERLPADAHYCASCTAAEIAAYRAAEAQRPPERHGWPSRW
jgi:hypothetical protein